MLGALAFAAARHRDQRRRDRHGSPFVNHPIEVACLLATRGRVTDPTTLTAAVLHDVVEDTGTSIDEVAERFGEAVARLVAEVTDDPTLERDERRRQQAARAPMLSTPARLIRIADKIANLRDLPTGWSPEMRQAYVAFARRVVDACRGASPMLETLFDGTVAGAARSHDDPTTR